MMIRVLLVEDNLQYACVVREMLDGQPDIEVAGVAGTLAEARRMLKDVDVAILDRVPPDGDSLELVGEMREAIPEIKVLVMSAFPEMLDPREALEVGADQVLGKHVPFDHLLKAIRGPGGEPSSAIHPPTQKKCSRMSVACTSSELLPPQILPAVKVWGQLTPRPPNIARSEARKRSKRLRLAIGSLPENSRGCACSSGRGACLKLPS